VQAHLKLNSSRLSSRDWLTDEY